MRAIGPNAPRFANEIGAAVRQYAPLNKIRWKDVTDAEKSPMYSRLENVFVLDYDKRPWIKEVIENDMPIRFKEFRYELHEYYKTLVDLPMTERKAKKHDQVLNQDYWDFLCNYWDMKEWGVKGAGEGTECDRKEGTDREEKAGQPIQIFAAPGSEQAKGRYFGELNLMATAVGRRILSVVSDFLIPDESPGALHFIDRNATGLQTNSTPLAKRGSFEDPTFKFQIPLQLAAEREPSCDGEEGLQLLSDATATPQDPGVSWNGRTKCSPNDTECIITIVLYHFLEFFSNFDWDNFCVSLWGPVPISSLPEIFYS
ncbi:ABC transporter domain-containing protein [Forsythia ovata]|uniref:ABC transporter domain-containing protein n=1 Tax=Forsythia ovata TaxID=205694 RepID=A0ABD1S0K6_9LAMI